MYNLEQEIFFMLSDTLTQKTSSDSLPQTVPRMYRPNQQAAIQAGGEDPEIELPGNPKSDGSYIATILVNQDL